MAYIQQEDVCSVQFKQARSEWAQVCNHVAITRNILWRYKGPRKLDDWKLFVLGMRSAMLYEYCHGWCRDSAECLLWTIVLSTPVSLWISLSHVWDMLCAIQEKRYGR